jgi:hypothetical protein
MIEYKNLKIFKGVEDLKIDIISLNEDSVEYTVSNTPICQWDQHSRARIGVKFLDYKVSDTPEYVMYTFIYNEMIKNENYKNKVLTTLLELEEERNKSNFKTDFNLMTRNCSYRVVQTFESLEGQMARRLKLCEEEFIVGTHVLLRDKLIKLGFEKAKKYKPGCDFIQKCDYSSADYLSNMFGCLFAGCGRWPSGTNFATFNFSCTTAEEIEQQLKIEYPKKEI